MSDKRLIDGDKLLDFCKDRYDMNSGSNDVDVGWRQALRFILREVKSGRFDYPSNQGEAARLREALEFIQTGEFAQVGHPTWITEHIDHALSFHTEDKDGGQS